jgi:hypothetical protein
LSKKNTSTIRYLRSRIVIAVTLLSFLFTITQTLEVALAITRSELDNPILFSSTTDAKTEISKNSYNNSNYNVMDNTTGSSSENQKIVQQHLISSSLEMLQGHEGHQSALILPPRNDSSVYSGIITFTANKPVEVQIYHIYEIDNHTDTYIQSAQTISAPFGDEMVTTSLIMPNYGSPPLFSASVPFTGDALGLHTTSGESFLAMYTVNVEIDKPAIVNNIEENQTSNGVSSNGQEVEAQEAPQEYHPTSPNLLGQVLSFVTPEILAELPLNDLPPDELVTMSKSVSADKFANILNQLPVEKRDEILNQLPVEKRDEILNQLPVEKQ